MVIQKLITTPIDVTNERNVRPSVTLKSKMEISDGDGTQTNPYVIK